jgi:hypothetical protein
MIYDPVQIARLEADAALLKQMLVSTGSKLTYKQFGQMIGLGHEDEWTQDDNEKLSMICHNIYNREYHCGAYQASTWAHITWETGSPCLGPDRVIVIGSGPIGYRRAPGIGSLAMPAGWRFPSTRPRSWCCRERRRLRRDAGRDQLPAHPRGDAGGGGSLTAGPGFRCRTFCKTTCSTARLFLTRLTN